MQQIFINYLVILILPFLAGFAVRFIVRRKRRAFVLKLCLMALAAILWGIAAVVPNHGSEANAITAMMAGCLAAGALAAGLVSRVRH